MLNEGTSTAEAAPDNFEAIEKAVMESRRGRWFLDEYARRRSGGETGTLLKAIGKLENTVASNHDVIAERLGKALGLMISVDAKLSSAPVASVPVELTPEHLKFFKQDEELFEPPAKTPAAAASPVAEARPEVTKGAKLVIRRQPETTSESAQAANEPVLETSSLVFPKPAADPPRKNRIVIVRHKAGEALDVPLHDELRASA
jgi:hypothetical protein